MRLSLLALLTAVMVVLMGCSGGGGTPLMPTIPGGDTDFGDAGNLRAGMMPDNGNFLWGYWQGSIDLASSEIELTQMRQAEFHANLTSVLQSHPLGLSYQFKGFDMIEKAVDVDVTLTHPYPNSDFRGFDARGIFMGPGNTVISQADPGVIYPAVDGTRVLNADGYTRWWNAVEFTTAGMYGYDDETVVPEFLIPETTLNPYKYFADCLSNDDPVVPNVNTSNRGTFSTEGNPPEVTRRYKIAFPSDGGYMKFIFHYAVDVSWAAPDNGTPAPKPIEDFPSDANCPEAYHIAVDTTGSTAFYKNETESGGDLQLAIEVFDWQADDNPFGIDGEIESIWLESETLFDTYYGTDLIAATGSMSNSGIYHITIPHVTPTGLDDQEVLITIRTTAANNTYAPPVSGPAYPEGALLAAYKLVEIPIKSIEPDALTVISPNGEESWGISSARTVTWSSYGEIENVNIDLSLDGGAIFAINLATDVENSGEFAIASVDNLPTTLARVKISDATNSEVFDISNADFTIEPFVHVTYPNGNEVLQVGDSPVIQWIASDCIDIVSIFLSQNSGQNYLVPVTYSAANNGSYIFYNIPEDYIGDTCRIKVAWKSDASVFDESDNDFAILPKMEDMIVVGFPTGDEELIAGTNVTITWAGDPNIPNVGINLSTNGGQDWPETIIDTIPNADGQFEWGPIPQALISPDCVIRVFDINNPLTYGDSGEFTIVEPGIELLTPNGGDVLEVGNQYEITWTASDIITDIIIEMSADSGGTYPYEIVASTPNTGSFLWDPIADWPETLTARIKISDADNPGLYYDESDSDFSFLERSVILNYPNGGEFWRLGFPQTIEWVWSGYIPLVDITMSIDGGAFDTILVADLPNTGTFEMASFFPTSLTQDHLIWNDTELGIDIQVTASDNALLNDASDGQIIVPLTLGILDDKNLDASGDTDDDGVKDDIEIMLGMNIDDFDSDHDGMYDYRELFSESGWNWEDLIPDQDADMILAPMDVDDNDDGVHDGELVDSDLDGVPNYLEYYGFTYNWLSGEFLKWDDEDVQEDFTVPYFKTDPMQPSTDQDPYNDGMEVSSLFMDQTVIRPGNSPMIPATPNIIVRLMGYDVTINADIEDATGGSESQGTTWGRETSQESGWTHAINWEIGVEATAKFGMDSGGEVAVHANLGGEHSYSTTTGTSSSTEDSSSSEVNWSTAVSTNPSQAAVIKLKLKVYNTGTASASNIVPTMTLCIGNHQVATISPSSQINTLPPNGEYPDGENIYWVINTTDTGEPIFLTLDELKAFEVGAPISIHTIQMSADVAAMNEDGYWEYVGDWGEYIARINSVCTHLFLDPGDGNVLSYMVYADNDPSSPVVTLRDALLWSGAYEEGSTILMPYRLPNGTWDTMDMQDMKWYVDYYIADQVPGNLVTPPPVDFNFMDVELTPDSYIVGKVPPAPPLDQPIIHWAVYDSANDMVLAGVTDYYAVDEVWLDGFNYGGDKDFMMEYNDSLGCYAVSVPGFSAANGLDLIKATNVVGIDADPFDLYEIGEVSDPPDPDDPYPSITSSSVYVTEYHKSLAVSAYATVVSDNYDITGVYLVNGDNTYLCQLSGPPEGGSFSFSANPAPFFPDGTERIIVVNEGSYEAQVPVASFYYPGTYYVGSQSISFPGSNGDFYLNLDTNVYHSPPRNGDDDIILRVSGLPSNYYLDFVLPMPNTVKWMLIQDFPHPGKDFIAGLTLTQSPTTIEVGNGGNELWINDSLVFQTDEGRYGYVYGIDAGGSSIFIYMRVYSLWDG